MGQVRIYARFARVFCGALLVCLVLGSNPVLARTCTPDEKAEADNKLWLNKRDTTAAINRHLHWGLPEFIASNDTIQVLAQRDYVIGYDLELRVPLWTAHRLNAKGLGKNERVDCFRRVPALTRRPLHFPATTRNLSSIRGISRRMAT